MGLAELDSQDLYLSIYLSIYLHIYLSIYQSIHLFIYTHHVCRSIVIGMCSRTERGDFLCEISSSTENGFKVCERAPPLALPRAHGRCSTDATSNCFKSLLRGFVRAHWVRRRSVLFVSPLLSLFSFLSLYLSIHPPIHPITYPSVCLSVCWKTRVFCGSFRKRPKYSNEIEEV